jgi:DNA-binding response OmpR family regulator
MEFQPADGVTRHCNPRSRNAIVIDSRAPKILLVEPDLRVSEMLVTSLVRRFDAEVTCTGRAEEALDTAMLEPHDLALAEIDLPGMDGITLAGHLVKLSDHPVILCSERPTLSRAIEALRLGAADFLPKPFSIPALLDAVEAALVRQAEARRRERRYRQLRTTVRRVLADRRVLNERLDLICRDLVGAHRRLVHRVLEAEQDRRVSS